MVASWRVYRLGIETADMLVQVVLSRNCAMTSVALSGLTSSPDESGKKRREQGRREPGIRGSGMA